MFKRHRHIFEVDVGNNETIEIRRKNMDGGIVERVDLFQLAEEVKSISNQLEFFQNVFGFAYREVDLENTYPGLKEEGDDYENKLKEIFSTHSEELEELKKSYLKTVDQCRTMEKIKKAA